MDGSSLFNEFNAILSRDPNIDELGFIVTDPYDDAEPPPFLLTEDHKLAIAFWSIPDLAKHAFTKFVNLKKHLFSQIQFSEDKMRSWLSDNRNQVKEIIECTRVILCINADSYTALNVRKRLIEYGFILPEEELQFLNLIFTKHPKSGESWSHRRWLFERIFRESSPLHYVKQEMQLCRRVGEIYPKNYYSWTHRMWVLKYMRNQELLEDLKEMEDWVRRNLSDHCGFHHRQFIMEQLLKNSSLHISVPELHLTLLSHNLNYAIADKSVTSQTESKSVKESNLEDLILIWQREFLFVEKLILLYPGHESVWSHRRFLILYWIILIKNFPSHWQQFYTIEDQDFQNEGEIFDEEYIDNVTDPKISQMSSNELRWPTISSELELCHNCMNDDQILKYEEQYRCAAIYKFWVMQMATVILSQTKEQELTPNVSSGRDELMRLVKVQSSYLKEVLAKLPLMRSVWRDFADKLDSIKVAAQ